MKTRIFLAHWAAAFGLFGNVAAADPIVALSPGTESRGKNLLLPVGTPRIAFLKQVGEPDAWLSANVCVYWNRRTNQPRVNQHYDTLLVEFNEARVTRLKMVDGAPVRDFLARREERAAAILASVSSPPRPSSK